MVTEYEGEDAPAATAAARAAALVDGASLAWQRDDPATARRMVDEAWTALAGIEAADADRLPALAAVGQRLEELERRMAAPSTADDAGIDRLLAWVEREGRQPEQDDGLERLLARLEKELGPLKDG